MNHIIILVLVIILIYLIYFFYNYNKQSNLNVEKFDYNEKRNDPKFIQDNRNNIISKDPNYRVENINQYNFDRLYKKLQKVNKEQINLSSPLNYRLYTQSTTDDRLRIDLDNITKYVLLVLNKDKYYNFSKTNYGNVETWTDIDNNCKYRYELFLWDKKNFFEIKLIIEIIKFPVKSNSEKFGIKDKKYIFENYNIGFPSKDQMIPLPIQIVPSGNFANGNSTISPNDPLKINSLYLNKVEIENSTLIINYEKNKYSDPKINITEKDFSGVTDMSLEYVNVKGDNTPFIEKCEKRNKWPTLDSEPRWKAQFPAKPPPRDWDEDGVYYYSEKQEKRKEDQMRQYCDVYEPGTIWSPMKMPLQPYYWPTLATIPRNCSENYWLFDQVGPNGTFFGGGKN